MIHLRTRGFSLIELLVVIGILGVLIALLLPGLRKSRLSARQVRAASDMRQLLSAYTSYHTENRGRLLFGYTPPKIQGKAVVVTDPVSGHEFGYPIADRYPWRLIPYCSRIWGILHSHTTLPPIPKREDAPADAMMKAYALSINPTFGINSIYVGGHAGPVFQGFIGPDGDVPNIGRHVVFRASEVRKGASLIVFAESQARNLPSSEPETGMHFITPPRAGGQRWTIANGTFSITSGMIMGLPQGRFGNRTVVGFFDSHVDSLAPSALEDMRLWSPKATRADWDFTN